MSNPPATCQNCDTPLPADAPGLVCPACLVGEALGSVDTVAHGVDTALPEDGNAPGPLGSKDLEGSTLGIGGRYKILQRIGEGGFGTVYMAEQTAPVRRRVAIKILKAGMDTHQLLARFEAERQALAMMDHPNIARVLDGGETEQGRPFFVMDLVRGDPITKFCDEESLSPADRLQLFLKVCRAVQHAHQKGIIHRDLKPSNILVTVEDGAEPVPKVIDFGVAKAMESKLTEKTLFTRFEQMIGTPAYMSPEQAGTRAAQDIDTRADIYALGVLLYELLTGTTPFDGKTLQSAAFDEVRRILREEEAPRPSARLGSMEGERRTTIAKDRGTEAAGLGKFLRGDLDWIVMKAIEKDRRRRYETANALALDIERHLGDEPVSAGSPTVGYRFSKFLRRNKTGVGVAAVVFLSLIGGLALATLGFARAKDEAAKAREAEAMAENEGAIARAINDFLVDDIIGQAGSDETPEAELTIKTALDRAAEQADARLADQPLVLAEVREVLRDAYRNMGFYVEALGQARAACDLLEKELGPDAERTLRAKTKLTHSLLYSGMAKEAREIIDPTLHRQRALLGERHPDTLDSTRQFLDANLSNAKEHVALARSFATNVAEVQVSDPEKVLYARRTLAKVLLRADPSFHKEAEELLRGTIEQSVGDLGLNHHLTLKLKRQLSDHYRDSGRLEDAKPLLVDVIDGFEASGGKNSARVIHEYYGLAVLLSRLGDQTAAEAMLAKAHAIGKSNPFRGIGQPSAVAVQLAIRLKIRRKDAEALQVLGETYQRLLPEINGDYSSRYLRSLIYNLAELQFELGLREEALETLRDPLRTIVEAEGLGKVSEELIFSTWAQLHISLHGKGGLRAALAQLNKESPEVMADDAAEKLLRRALRNLPFLAGDRAGRDGDWAAARDHYGELLTSSLAEEDFAESLPVEAIGYVLLKVEDYESCRQACEFFVTVYERADRWRIEQWLSAKIALTIPGSQGKALLERSMIVVREMTSSESEESPLNPWFCLSRGIGEYRSGDTSEARVWLEKAKSGWAGWAGWADCRATAHAYHALVAKSEGQIEVAIRELRTAEEYALERTNQHNPGVNWYNDVGAEIALEEARREILFTGTKLISPTATWSFLHPDDGADPATTNSVFHRNFAQVAFDDSSWQTGADGPGYDGGFGYGWPVSTEWEVPEEGKRKSAYLRHSVSTTESHTDLLLHLRVDDGVIVYLDGMEVGRFNIATNEADRYGLTAERELSRFERANHRLIRLKGKLAAGEHVLALSVHNASDTSPDLGVGSISLYGTPVE